jgi:acetyltransferase-like isoleucine patch superfamily enzyme
VYSRSGFTTLGLGAGGAAWRSFDRGAVVGLDCLLGPNARCANGGPPWQVRLGRGVVCRGILRRETFGDGRIEIGDEVYIGDDCIISCSEHVAIGDGTLLGHGVQVFDNNSHPVDPIERQRDWQAVRVGGVRAAIRSAPVTIGPRAWIGFGSIILKGVTIGEEAIVGAGSVVSRDVAPHTTVAGNPAQAI